MIVVKPTFKWSLRIGHHFMVECLLEFGFAELFKFEEKEFFTIVYEGILPGPVNISILVDKSSTHTGTFGIAFYRVSNMWLVRTFQFIRIKDKQLFIG